MRTLKKTLCLVLALVMMLGLCAFNVAAADFSDADKITYKEAVGVLTGIGVIKGMGDSANTFNPNGTLTRAQACTIITKLMGADGISAKSTFTDMEGAAWAESYVAYCQAKGIVGGYGDGRFGPNDTLTGSQWGRMLLLAAGLDAKENGFESGNANWEIGVAKAVKDKGLAARITGFNATQGISRDAACEMAFKALDVSVSGKKVYVVDGLDVEFETWFEAYIAADDDATAVHTSTPSDSLHSQNFPSLVEVPNQTDDFGRTTTEWRYGEKADVIYTVVAPAAKSFTVAKAVVNADMDTDAELVDSLNTALKLTTKAAKLKAPTAPATIDFAINGNDSATKELKVSDEVQVFADKNNVVSQVIVTRYEAAKITKVEALKASELAARDDDATSKVSLTGSKTVIDSNFAGFAYAKDDIVLVAYNTPGTGEEQKVLASKLVETVEGSISRKSVLGLTVGGKLYAKSGIDSTNIGVTNVAADATNFNDTYILYLAQDGTYVAIEKKTDKADTSVAYIASVYSKWVATAGTEYTDGGAYLYYIQCVNLDGDVVSYPVKTNEGKAPTFAPGLYTLASDPGKDDKNPGSGSQSYVKPTAAADENDANTNALLAASKVVTNGAVSARTTTSIAGTGSNKFYLNASQKVIFVTGTLDKIKVTVKTGKTDIAADTTYTVYGTRTKADSTNYDVKAIFVAAPAPTASTGTGKLFGVGPASGQSYYTDANGDNITTNLFNVWIDGEAKEIMTGTGVTALNGVFNYKIDDVTGLYIVDTTADKYQVITVGTVSNNHDGRVDITKTDGSDGNTGNTADVDLTEAKLVNAINPFLATDAYNACPTTADELKNGATITVVFSEANGVKTPVVVYVTNYPVDA